MATLLIAGVRDSDKETILALLRKITTLPAYEFVDFDEVVMEDRKLLAEFAAVGAFDSLTKLKSWGMPVEEKSYAVTRKGMERFYQQIAARLKEAGASGKHVLASGYFYLSTQYGHVPVLSQQFLSTFHPDAIILIETDASGKIHVVDEEYGAILHDHEKVEEARELVLQQAVARAYAGAFAAVYGGLFRVVTVRRGKVRQALKDVLETVRFVFGDV